MRLHLFLIIAFGFRIVSAAPAASNPCTWSGLVCSKTKHCETDCGPKKCRRYQFCKVYYEHKCKEEPAKPKYKCVDANYATYSVGFSRELLYGSEHHSDFYRTDIFSDCKKGHARNLTWKWPAPLAHKDQQWIVPFFDPFLRHYEGSQNEMYMWKSCECGMHACPESFNIKSEPNRIFDFQEFSYEFSCRKECNQTTTKAVEANFTKSKNGTQDFEGNVFLPTSEITCTKNESLTSNPRNKPPEAQFHQTCPTNKTITLFAVLTGFLLVGGLLLSLSLLVFIVFSCRKCRK